MTRSALVDFVLPGLNIAINSAQITSGGVISVTYTITDPTGLALDQAGAVQAWTALTAAAAAIKEKREAGE
jgi:hypothetical protein